ncbi:MAG: SH3 domain-containing protein [Spirochaetes bacterium]|nr:SH3 domain-containing protein [Spirochaetota bacterium]
MKKLIFYILSCLILLSMTYSTKRQEVQRIYKNSILLAQDMLENSKDQTNVLLSRYQIKRFNRKMTKQQLIIDILDLPSSYKKKKLKRFIKNDIEYIKLAGRYNKYNHLIPLEKRDLEFKRNMNVEGLKKKNHVQYGVITKNCSLRLAPSYEYRMAKENDFHFDILQVQFLQRGDAVVVMHRSYDKKWYFAQTQYSRGWIEQQNIRILDKKTVEKYLSGKKLIVTGKKVKVYYKPGSHGYYYLYMGKAIPFAKEDKHYYHILLPLSHDQFETNYIPVKEDTSRKYLPFTRKNLVIQAVKMLGERYGWGGENGDTDCSSFFTRFFKSFGVDLPKGSMYQIKGLKRVRYREKNKLDAINKLTPFQSFLYKPGHIMLYIGTYNEVPLVLHNVWKYRLPDDTKIIIGSVVITDLSLGNDSSDGSFFQQITRIGRLY